jgi:hypothetical protein
VPFELRKANEVALMMKRIMVEKKMKLLVLETWLQDQQQELLLAMFPCQ